MTTDYSALTADLKGLSRPAPSGDKIKRAIKRAADAAGLHYWRAFDIWYGKARRIDADEADRIRAAVQHKSEEEARHEYQDLRTRLLKMESRLAASGSDGHREAFDGMRTRFR